jgi:prepilin-type processing-associated H-X9-DG protein
MKGSFTRIGIRRCRNNKGGAFEISPPAETALLTPLNCRRTGRAPVNIIVGIFIVALVGGAVVPAVTATRKRAAEVECLSNLGQIARANLRMTLQSQEKMIWARQLITEAGLPETTYRCPAAWEVGDWGSVTQAWKYDTTIPEGRLRLECSYTINDWTLPAELQNRRGGPEFFIKPSSPGTARVPVFGDGTWIDAYPLESDPTPPDLRAGDRWRQGNEHAPRENMLGRFTIARHRQTINIGFLDGHAEAVKLSDLKRLTWHEGWKPQDWMPALPAE